LIHFHLFIFIAAALYLSECVIPLPAGGWLMLSLFKKFKLTRGPALGFRNPYPQGFSYRFPPPGTAPRLGRNLHWEEAQIRLDLYRQKAEVLFWLSRGILFVVLSAILIYEFRLGFGLVWVLLFCVFLYLHTALIQSLWSAHKALCPGQEKARWKCLFLCLFSPWQSSRAMDLLGAELFSDFHPFAVGKVLLEDEERNRFFRRWLLELKYPAVSSRDKKEANLLLTHSPEKELKSLTLWMVRIGLNYQASLASPAPTHPSQKSYCPRCDIQYTIERGVCHDCGRDLILF
jgi:hypothetical protein